MTYESGKIRKLGLKLSFYEAQNNSAGDQQKRIGSYMKGNVYVRRKVRLRERERERERRAVTSFPIFKTYKSALRLHLYLSKYK